VYLVRGMAVSLPFLACLADERPEAIAAPRQAASVPVPTQVKERRGPRRWITPKAERPPRMTDAYVRRALAKTRCRSRGRDRIKYEMAMKRIARGGA
jgi:hypothetical protein